MTSQTRKQTITIHVLPDISRSKCNQTIKFGQLIECNRNIFLEKSSTKCCRKTSPRSFFKKSKLSISRDQQSEVSYSLLLLYVQAEAYQKILKLRCWPLGFTSYIKLFYKTKKDLKLVSLPHFLHDFWRRIFIVTEFRCLTVFIFWDIWQYVYCNCLFPSLWSHKVWNWPYLA